jgi:hypothetical protein
MTRKQRLVPVLASLLAFGSVGIGSHLEQEAQAANRDWNYVEECSQGCSNEEANEYHKFGSFGEEVRNEVGTLNREETLELTAHSQHWCYQLMTHMAYSYSGINTWTRCAAEYPTLGY